MLDREFKYYLENQDELIEKYNGKYLVIVGEEVKGVYENEESAYFESSKEFESGTFLIQYCGPGEDSYTQSFHSRVVFN